MDGAVTTRLRGWSDGIRTRLWPLPVVGVVSAVVAGFFLPRLDLALETSRGAGEPALYLFGGGAAAARDVLSAIAGSLVTATSLTFSLTVVTLQLASSQYSPRLLRTFTRDGAVQATLALFLSTFTYSLMVLRDVRSGDSGALVDDVFVPRISVTVAVALTLASVIGLVLFLAHLAREIRVETVLERVHAEACEVVALIYPTLGPQGDEIGADAVEAALARAGGDPVTVRASSTGFVTAVDQGALLRAADRRDGFVVLDVRVGDFVVAGAPIGRLSAPPGADEGFGRQVADAVSVGSERTAVQDPAFGLRQMVDVAVRALSPGINDPTTAVHALGWTCALLVDLSGRRCGPAPVRDDDEVLRAVVTRPSFSELVAVAIEQPLLYGSGDPHVAERLASTLGELARVSETAEQRITVRSWLARVLDALPGSGLPEHSQRRVEAVCASAHEQLELRSRQTGAQAGAAT